MGASLLGRGLQPESKVAEAVLAMLFKIFPVRPQSLELGPRAEDSGRQMLASAGQESSYAPSELSKELLLDVFRAGACTHARAPAAAGNAQRGLLAWVPLSQTACKPLTPSGVCNFTWSQTRSGTEEGLRVGGAS